MPCLRARTRRQHAHGPSPPPLSATPNPPATAPVLVGRPDGVRHRLAAAGSPRSPVPTPPSSCGCPAPALRGSSPAIFATPAAAAPLLLLHAYEILQTSHVRMRVPHAGPDTRRQHAFLDTQIQAGREGGSRSHSSWPYRWTDTQNTQTWRAQERKEEGGGPW